MDETLENYTRFFEYIWGDVEGYVYLPVEQIPGNKDSWHKTMYAWPRQKKAVAKYVLSHEAAGSNIFFAPAIFAKANPNRDNVLGSRVLWADIDSKAPEEWPKDSVVPEPTLVIQSSYPDRQHCYWLLDEFVSDLDVLEERNRAIALAINADTSGWDANQLLRPVGTTNRKHNLPVKVKTWRK